jgi:hypothetical protein
VGARFFVPVQTGPGAHPASSTMGTEFFLGGGAKSGRGMTLTPHLLVPWSRKGRAIPLLTLWAVQSLSACTGAHFTLPLPLFIPSAHIHLYKLDKLDQSHCKAVSPNYFEVPCHLLFTELVLFIIFCSECKLLR